MKTKIIFLLSLFCVNMCLLSKTIDDEIVLKNGTKAIIEPNSFKVDYERKIVYFRVLGSKTNREIGFKDFVSVEFGANKFQSFKLNHANVHEGYFVIAEKDSKKLILHTLPQEEEGVVLYEFHIIVNDNEIIDSHSFDNKKAKKSHIARSDIYGKIKFHFPGNIQLLKRLEMFDKDSFSSDNTKILGFFNNPIYFKTE